MEVVYRNNRQDKITLPKNVRQIGTEQGKRRVYIEDYAYSFIKDLKVDEDDDGVVGILLGETQESDGITYVFIKGVVEVTNAAVFTDHIAFTEETWPVTRKYIDHYFRDFNILGWYLNSSKITEKNMDIINTADSNSFCEPDNIFFMVNSAAGDEVFMEKSKKGLTPLSGYTVYFEKNTSMQRYMKEMQSEYDEVYSHKDDEPDNTESDNAVTEPEGGKYRTIVKSEKNQSAIKRNLTFIYALSMLVIIVVLIIGVNKINSYDKMNAVGDGETLEANATVGTEAGSKTPVTTLEGNVTEETTTEEPTTEEPTTEEPTTEEPTTEEPTTEEDKYEVYVVQKGDSMWGICVKFYGEYTPEAAAKIVEFNGLASADELSQGAELKIPMN